MTTKQMYKTGIIEKDERDLINEAEKTNIAQAAQMRINAWYNFRIMELEKKVSILEAKQNTFK